MSLKEFKFQILSWARCLTSWGLHLLTHEMGRELSPPRTLRSC